MAHGALPSLALLLLVTPTVALDYREASREDVARALVQTREPVELRRGLVLLGAEAIPHLFEVLFSGRVPADWRPDVEHAVELASDQLEIVRSALGMLPRAGLRAFLTDLAASGDEAHRLAGIALLGEVGAASDFDVLSALAEPRDPRRSVVPRRFRKAVAAALGRMLDREALEVRGLRKIAAEAPPGLMTTVVRVLGAAPTAEAARVLASLLGRDVRLDPVVLSQIAARGRTGHALIDDDTREAVRAALKRTDEPTLAAAARAAGVLGDEVAIEELLRLGSHDASPVRVNALAAMKAITGLGYGADMVRWRAWHAAEMVWWDTRSAQVLLDLETATGVDFTRTIVEALKRRLFRDRIAASLVLRLRDEDPACVRLTCGALAQLGTGYAVGELVACLGHADPAAAHSAWQALRRITGHDLPPEPERWLEVLGPDS